jgi:hypothetical protein
MQSKVVKFVLVCLTCLAIVAGLVFIIKLLT